MEQLHPPLQTQHRSGAVLLSCQDPARAWGLSGQHLSSRETTQVDKESFCLAAFTYNQTPVPKTGWCCGGVKLVSFLGAG